MTDIQKQREFFDVQKNAYSQNLIVKPPFHTVLEINQIIKRIEPNSDVADFGAGSGRISIPLLQKGFKTTAVDISGESLKNLELLAKSLKLNRLTTSKTFPEGMVFGTIVGADILHHVDLDKYLRIIFMSLKKGGKIVFSEPCALNPSWYIYLPFASSWRIEKGIINCTYGNLRTKLKKAGFKNIKILGLGFFPRPFLTFSKPLCRLNDAIGNLPILKLFAYRYIIEAVK